MYEPCASPNLLKSCRVRIADRFHWAAEGINSAYGWRMESDRVSSHVGSASRGVFITRGYNHRMEIPRITHDPAVMGGKPCIRGLRVTVGTVLGLLAAGQSRERILQAYPYLEPQDLDAALAYAAWRMEEREEPLVAS